MITVKKADSYRMCNCCHSTNDVNEINFHNEYSGIEVALCAECRERLIALLMYRERRADNG